MRSRQQAPERLDLGRKVKQLDADGMDGAGAGSESWPGGLKVVLQQGADEA